MGQLHEPSPSPPFLEVECKSCARIRRFAAGTEAGFALYLINRKLDVGMLPALHIEAVKEGEEPISFGPNSVLVNYGEGWKLQTVPADDYEDEKRVHPNGKKVSPRTKLVNYDPETEVITGSGLKSNFVYFGKILLAFGFMFLLAGTFTLILENLPRLILFLNSSL